MRSAKPTSISTTHVDRALLKRLKAKLGHTHSVIYSLGLRALAQKEGIIPLAPLPEFYTNKKAGTTSRP